MKKKVGLSQNFYLGCVYIPSCEAHKHCRAEIAQYRLEIIFKPVTPGNEIEVPNGAAIGVKYRPVCRRLYEPQPYKPT